MSKTEKAIAILLGSFFLWLMVMLGSVFKAEADCLAQGFPKASVTWKFDTYCIGYDGAVKPVVKRIDR